MNLFNSEDKLKNYTTIPDIIDDYFSVRLAHYGLRKDYLIDNAEKELIVLSNKSRYVTELLDGTIDLRKKKKTEINEILVDKGYNIIENDEDYKYLVKMPMDSVSEENIEKINKDHHNKLDELNRIKTTTIQQMWLSELELLEQEYLIYQVERERALMGDKKTDKKKSVVKVTGNVKKIKKVKCSVLEIV